MKRGSLKYEQFVRWIDRIYKTADAEADCDQVRGLVAAYVDSKITDSVRDPVYAPLLLHLDQCMDCNELYESLYRIAELEAWGDMPSAGVLFDDVIAGTDLSNGEVYS